MANGFLGLSIGRSSLLAHQRALETTSQNLANANTEGYSRKRVHFEGTAVLNLPDTQGPTFMSQIGSGVGVEKIEAVRDLMLNARIRGLKTEFAESERQQEVLDELESVFIGEIDIARSLDDFFAALSDLSASPESLTVRSVVRARAVELTDRVRAAAENIEMVDANLSSQIESAVDDINGITTELAQLNEKVAAMVSSGLSPNDFEDRRQVLLERLAKYGNLQTVDGEVSQLTVLLGGQVLVQGFQSFDVEVQTSGAGQRPVLAVGSGPFERLEPSSGVLRALTDLRDGTITRLRGDLNEFAVTFTDTFNAIHSAGFGLDGSTGVDFFTVGTPEIAETDVFSVQSTVFVENTTIPLDGDASTSAPENFEANPIGRGGMTINGTGIVYDASVDSLEDLVERINASSAGVVASITPQNRLHISATRGTDFTISQMGDGGNLLGRLGILPSGSAYPPGSAVSPPSAVFTATVALKPREDAALRFEVSALIKADLNRIAAAEGDDLSNPPDGVGDRSRGVGDGANALALSQLREVALMTTGTATFNDFLVAMVGELGVESGSARRSVAGLEAQINQLEQRRQEIQGVSIDEELINMIKYQRGFEASARIISVMDEVLQTLLALGR